MALTISPYAHRINASPLSVTPSSPTPYPIMSRSVSINMDGMPEYGNDPENVEGLDMEMVPDFDGMVNFGGPSEGAKIPQGSEYLHSPCRDSHLVVLTLAHPSVSGPPKHHHDPHHPPSSSHGQMNPDDVVFQTETGLEGGSDDDDGALRLLEADLTPPDSPAPHMSKRRRETQDVPGGFTYVDKDGESGRRKIRIEYITDKSRRHITFSKRKAGIMKKVRNETLCIC